MRATCPAHLIRFTSTSSIYYDVMLRCRDKFKSCEHAVLAPDECAAVSLSRSAQQPAPILTPVMSANYTSCFYMWRSGALWEGKDQWRSILCSDCILSSQLQNCTLCLWVYFLTRLFMLYFIFAQSITCTGHLSNTSQTRSVFNDCSSCRWGETASLNSGHCSSPEWYMTMEPRWNDTTVSTNKIYSSTIKQKTQLNKLGNERKFNKSGAQVWSTLKF
jgi:hypothetical protein